MPGREIVDAQESATTAASTIVLLEAGKVGIADICAGRYREFRASGDLAQHLHGLLDRIISARTVIR